MRELTNLRFLGCTDPNILAWVKLSADRTNCVVAAVNLDPFARHEDEVELPLAEFGLAPDAEFVLEEAFTGRTERCRGARRRLSLDPATNPTVLFRLVPVVNR
jgi:starch synthase (maltosyl-transferring)